MNFEAQRQRAADWHAHQAVKAYRRRPADYEAYLRHIRIADQIRSEPRG